MSRRTRVLLVLAGAILIALLLAPAALASAGGGSAGYGGGGEGGGGGRGFEIYILIQLLIRIAVLGHGLGALVLIGVFLLWFLFARVMPSYRSRAPAARHRTARRERRVQLAAAEAAEYDPAFAPDMVKPAAARLFADIQAAWDRGDRRALARLVGPDLLAEWERRLDDFQRRGWRNRVAPVGEPRVEYVGLTRRGDARDRVVVRIEAKLRDYVEDHFGKHLHRVGRISETVRVREFWTLGRSHGHWVLLSIEQGAEGTHALDEAVVATPWSDQAALRDEALLEGAQALPEGTSVAEVADLDFDGDARAAALDLSLADGRFAPDVLEVAARRAVAAWAEAVDGDDSALNAIADRAAVQALLHPGDPSERTRLVVRGPKVEHIAIVALDAAAEPPTMAIDVQLTGRRYTEDRASTAVLEGSREREARFAERFTLALTGEAQSPWRVVAVRSPSAAPT